jgi:hypothetical protein
MKDFCSNFSDLDDILFFNDERILLVTKYFGKVLVKLAEIILSLGGTQNWLVEI